MPRDFDSVLGRRRIKFKKTAPHEAELKEYKNKWTRTPRGSSYRKAWVELDAKKDIPKDMSRTQRECWFAVATGASDCRLDGVRRINDEIDNPQFAQDTDLLKSSRRWVQEVGLRRTRDLMPKALAKLDTDNQLFEKRSIYVRKHTNFVFSDSLMKLSRSERAKVGIYAALGYGHDSGTSAMIVRRMIAKAKALGFRAKSFDTLPVGKVSTNSEIINQELRAELNSVDSMVLFGASKGGQELTHFYLHHLPRWSERDQSKIHAVVSLSGVLRSSYIADWVATAKGIRMELLRFFSRFKTHEKKNLEGIKSTRIDAWENYNYNQLPAMHDNFVWINFSMIPSDEDGHIPDWAILASFSRHAMRFLGNRGPTDGLVETAGTVLPPGTGIRQWIVRVMGPHVPTYGYFVDGTSVANTGDGSDEAIVASGEKTMEYILKALPLNPVEVSP